jgi:hypothetical protein
VCVVPNGFHYFVVKLKLKEVFSWNSNCNCRYTPEITMLIEVNSRRISCKDMQKEGFAIHMFNSCEVWNEIVKQQWGYAITAVILAYSKT